MTWNKASKWLVPAVIIAVGGGSGAYLARLDKTVKVTDQGVPVAAPAPGQPQRPPDLPPGAVIRSLDQINAAAAAVGCDTLKGDDPAGKLIDVAECLGAKALAAKGKQ